MADLGIERYEPPIDKSTYGNFIKAPSNVYAPKFDVESYQRYKHVLEPGEEVIITEKIHGANARFTYAQNPDTGEWQQYCGSRTNWMGKDAKNIWWLALDQNPAIGEWCEANPNKVLYGEVFGQVQNLKYGAGPNSIFFAAFGVLDKQNWVNYWDMIHSMKEPGLLMAPFLWGGPFDEKLAYELAEQNSSWPNANHMREGVVIVPKIERRNEEIGRVCLKIVSNRYLEKN